MTWQTVIGLEVHVQLKTASKMFCSCSTDPASPPNTNVCPVCLGLPGALPIPNEHAVRLAVRAALALGCTVHDASVFARKHYMYPDLPKGYQISQFTEPLATGGEIAAGRPDDLRVIRLTRVHLEEDAGKSFHDRFPDETGVDLNRCGVPLIEIVSEPEIDSPDRARRFLNALKQTLEYLLVSDCNMEEGSLRVDANLSVRRSGDPLGVKQEVKNMNSFSAVVRALEQLREQQIRILDRGDRVTLTTFSAGTGELRHLRTKEESHDYRYLPEPDLPTLRLSHAGIDAAREREELPELPGARRERFQREYGIRPYDAEVLTSSRALAAHYEDVVRSGADPQNAAHWVMGPVLADAKASGMGYRVGPERVAALTRLVAADVLSQQAGKRVFAVMTEEDEDPRIIAERLGLIQVRDPELLEGWVTDVLSEHPAEVDRYRAGEQKLMGFFTGRVMKKSAGRADPKSVQAVIRERLG